TTVAVGGTKVAALALIVVPWAAFIGSAIARRRWFPPVVFGLGAACGIVLITPASWVDPVAYLRNGIMHMAAHPWLGCTLTDGSCIGIRSKDWSTIEYLKQWALVQLPLVAIVGVIPA